MTFTDAAARDWPPSEPDASALAAPRRKRSKVVLWELVAIPIAVIGWGYAIYNFTFYESTWPEDPLFLDVFFYGTAGVLLMGFVLTTGVLLGIVVTGAVGTLYGFSARIPKTSVWVSSALVLVWAVAALILWHEFFTGLNEITSELHRP